MKRPFASKRPVGPFVSQSEEFAQDLLNRDNRVGIERGDVILIEILSKDSSDVKEAADILDEILLRRSFQDHAGLEEIGGMDGRREQVGTDLDAKVAGRYYFVNDAAPELTLGQIEQYVEQEVGGSGLRINGVNIMKTSR